jgi:hypothetical protein
MDRWLVVLAAPGEVRLSAAELGFDALDLSQGENFLEINEDGAAQLMASSVPLESWAWS